MRRTLTAAAAAAVSVLCLAGSSWPAAAQPAVPPPVDPGQRPSAAEAGTTPYQGTNQVGPAVPVGSCIDAARERGPRPDSIPAVQRRMRIAEAHEFATGRGQTVAVIDSGVNPHPRLEGRLDDGGDYILGESGTSDCEGHGTVVAGIVAAGRYPDTGFVGVAPDARILAIRQSSRFFEVEVTDPTGRTTTQSAGDTTSMARAIVHAVGTPGVSVINISEAACIPRNPANRPSDRDLQAAVRYAADNDVVVVAAAANIDKLGNAKCRQNPEGGVQTIVSPAWFDQDVLAVGATDVHTGAPASFTISGPWVDVAAPGTGIVSLDPASDGLTDTLAYPNGDRDPIAGTSFATPYVAGVAALVRDRYPELTARQVIERIQRTAQHTAGPGGRDRTLGYGVIDPVAALTDILPREQAAVSEPVEPARLQDFRMPVPEDPARRTVAFAGAGAGIAALGITVLTVYTLRRYHRSKLGGGSSRTGI
jgi:membrane-anchored mycosin MYCP